MDRATFVLCVIDSAVVRIVKRRYSNLLSIVLPTLLPFMLKSSEDWTTKPGESM